MWCFLGAKKGGPTPPPSIIKARRSVFPPKSGLRLRQRRISRVSNPSPILSIALFCFDHLLSSIGCLLRSLHLIFFFLIFLRRDVWFLSRSDTGDASEFDVYGFWFGHQGMIFIDFFFIFFCVVVCVFVVRMECGLMMLGFWLLCACANLGFFDLVVCLGDLMGLPDVYT